MDKKEYQEKLNEIGRLIAVEDYNSAAQVADSIEWKRVRNVQTLLMVSEIYEAVDRYQDSKILLQRAYRRSPLGRTVLYRLVECTVALKQFDEAIEYYSEYVQAAPRDNNKYILKYKIYRGRGSSLDEQIDILKEYLAQEKDSERWSYELAKLYREAGRTQECINTCDDLVLWYQSGKYVIKALELKKKIAPLTPRQQEIYDGRFSEDVDDDRDEDDEASYFRQARAERASLQQDAIKSELAEDISRAARQKAAETKTGTAPEYAAPQTEGQAAPANVAGQAAGPAAQTEAPAGPEAQTEAPAEPAAQAEAPAGPAAQAETPAEPAAKEEVQAEPAAETAIPAGQVAAPEKTAQEEPVPADPGVHYDEKTLKQNLAESMKAIVRGVGPRDEVDEEQEQLDRVIEQSKEDQEAAVASRGLGMALGMRQAGEKKQTAPKLTIDDILLSMDDKGDSVLRAVNQPQIPEGVLPADEEALMNSRASRQMNLAASEDNQTDIPEEGDRRETEPGTKAAAEQSAVPEQDAAAEQSAVPEQDAAAEQPETEEIEPAEAPVKAKSLTEEQSPENSLQEDILEAKTRVIPTSEIRRLHEQFLRQENEARSAGERMAEKVAAEAQAQAAMGAGTQTQAAMASGTQTQAAMTPEEPGQGAEASGSSDQTVPSQETPARTQEEDRMPSGEQVMKEVHAEENGRQPQYQTSGKTYLKPYHRDLFRGFLEIGNLEEQIARAIKQAEEKGDDRTSRTGNVLILGGHGCGKTTIATGIAKAVAEDMGTHSVKMARIYAADLNRKDIAATIAKIAGGVLIIEEAGDLEDSIVDQLTTAMEFRTDGMIMILEDEQRYIHDLLMRHPRFTMKFTAQIYIPAFTSKDLVNFGQLYAESRDCTLSEDARQALTGRLEAAAKSGETVSITNVVELCSRAIKNSQKFFRRIQSSKKRYDDQNRVVLRAKDLR